MEINARRIPLYIGGFMGPFGTVVIVPMFPELRDAFDASSQAVSWGFTAYLLPFALLLLVSGTLGERWGRKRTVRVTYVAYAAASLLCALAPTLGVFIVGRMMQGVANAFITPLMLAGLAETAPPERVGRLIGIYGSFQAFGAVMGSVVGGLAADWRYESAFLATAVIAAVLALFPPDGDARSDVEAPKFRPLLTPPMFALGIAIFAAAMGPMGANVVIGVYARDVLGLSGGKAGLVLMVGSLSAMAAGPYWGRVLDRIGQRSAGVSAAAATVILTASLVFADSVWMLVLLWAVLGAFVAYITIVFQAVGATVIPDNRGGALSFILAFRFLGHAAGPLVFLALLERSVNVTFLALAALGLVGVGVFARHRVDAATT